MAIKEVNRQYSPSLDDYIEEYILDTPSDVPHLPNAPASSMAVVATTGDVYVVNASGQWVPFGG